MSAGFEEVFHTADFGAFEAGLSGQLGSHRSHLREGCDGFHASCRSARVGPLQLLLLRGRGELELDRTQLGCGVLWIPLRGRSEERINGRLVQVEPGQALLFRQGDHLLGVTDKEVAGLSVLLPEPLLGEAGSAEEAACSPRRHTLQSILDPRKPADGGLIQATRRLAKAVARRDPTSAIAAADVLDQLADILPRLAGGFRGRGACSLAARKRWELLVEASRWMEAHLQEGFRAADLAAALQTPVRTLQWSFAQELGRSPLAHARLLRLHALRRRLQEARCRKEPVAIASQMAACGLPACGDTARAYWALFGELPRQTLAG
jgi:AraC-like DNA-binding protein